MSRNTLTFNGRTLLDYGVYISGEGTYNAPVRSVSQEVVAGRNGVLILDNGRYENIEVTYPAYIISNFDTNMMLLRQFLCSVKGYARLEDTYHPDEYYMATFTNGIEVQTSGRYNTEGQFSLTFNRKPQRFLTAGEDSVTFGASGNITNPTLCDAKPIIQIYGTGTVGIGDTNVTFDGSSTYVELDCELQDAYYNGQNKNSAITLSPNEFPVLHSGTNGITLGAGITRVVIFPRYWLL